MIRIFLGFGICVICVIFSIYLIIGGVKRDYEYNNNIYSNWTLADKSSTLSEKSKYIQSFIDKLKDSRHSDYNAIWLKTPDNSFEKNMQALQSLSDRLKKIQTIDENSFAYQTAIQQITAQEQGEASKMLNELSGCYFLGNEYYLWWEWIAFCTWIIIIITFFVFFFIAIWKLTDMDF